jgi:Holliday junction resolvase-like predicted endonuclease
LSNYSRGRSREYQAMHYLREQGYVCSRSAMSHGPVDVFAAKEGEILLIQVKSGSARIKKAEQDIFRRWAEHFDASAEVWYYRRRRKLRRVPVRTKIAIAETISVSPPLPA